MVLSPAVAGSVRIRSAGPDFVEAFARRVRAGLFPGASPSCSCYAVSEATGSHLAFHAALGVSGRPTSSVPGLSLEENPVLAWGSAVFWGFVWPWILIAMHRPAVRRSIERLIADVDGGAGVGEPRST